MDFIRVYDNALPENFCDELIKTFESHPGSHLGRTGAGVDTAKKRSLDLTLDHFPDMKDSLQIIHDITLRYLACYIKAVPASLIGGLTPTVKHPKTGETETVDLQNFEEIGLPYLDSLVRLIFRSGVVNMQKYQSAQGGYPHWHSEIYPEDEQCEPLHRVLLYMFYLNDVEKGGETEFYFQQRKISPKKGTMVIAPAGFTHTHRGNVPLSGDKYIVTSWVMYRRAEQIYGNSG